MRRFMAFLAVLWLLLPSAALAHSGRTDGIGGHYDNITGIYHFHHGHSAHHHPGGVCPYDSSHLYPTDKPPRASGVTRSGTSYGVSSSRYYSFATIRPTGTPAPAAASSRKTYLPGMAFVLCGTAATFGLMAWRVTHARKVKAAKTIMTAQPGETFRKEHNPAVTKPLAAPQRPAVPPAKPQPVFPAPAPFAVTAADPTLIKVDIVSGYHVSIVFSNGETRYFDFLLLLLEEPYAALSDYALFQDYHISVSRLLLCWDHFNITISAKRLYQESQPHPTDTVKTVPPDPYAGLTCVNYRDPFR